MTVASCPSCHESVTVPVDATPQCIVRCPLCHEEFKLEAFLAQLPPALIVLSAEPTSTSAAPAGQSDAVTWHDVESSTGAIPTENHLDQDVRTDNLGIEDPEAIPAFEFTPGSVIAQENADTADSPTRRGLRRPKNSTWEAAKIVGGALLAIPAAQIILWWFVPGDWKRDLLGMGPAISRVAPWIVPQKFHARAEPSATDMSIGLERPTDPQRIQPRRARPRASNGSALGQSAFDRPPVARDVHPPESSGGSDRPSDESDRPESAPKPEDLPSTAVTPPSLEPNASSRTTEPADPAVTEKTQVVSRVRGAPQFSTTDLRQAFDTALQASISWDSAENADQQQTDAFYTACAQLGETITYMVPTHDPAERDLVSSVREFFLGFQQTPKKLAAIGNRSVQWLDQSDRSTQGVVLFGTVRQKRMAGKLHVTELALAAIDQRTVLVASHIDPGPFYQDGDRVLMLGTIVPDPATQLLGYEGNESMVVLGGLPIVLRKK